MPVGLPSNEFPLQTSGMETDLVKTQISQLQMMIKDEERKMKKYRVCRRLLNRK